LNLFLQLILFLTFVSALAAPLLAQETVFNVPSGDILDPGKVYGEFDFSYRPSDSLKTFTPRVVVGIGHRLEIGVNINGIATPVASQTTLTPNIKWKLYDGGKNGWSFLVGDNLFIPVQNKSYNIGTWAYAEFVKSWKTNTRATFGAYYSSRDVFAPFQRAGGQFAIEQGIGKRLTLAADWFTGNSGAGYITSGSFLKITKKVTWYMSYQIGNTGVSSGNHQLLTEIGWNWN
jgi:hypothetical protein